MAQHIWNVKKYSPYTLQKAIHLLKVVYERGITENKLALQTVCYVMEVQRQYSGGNGVVEILDGAELSGYRFSRGAFAGNYLRGAEQIFRQVLSSEQFGEDYSEVPYYAFWDLLLERYLL